MCYDSTTKKGKTSSKLDKSGIIPEIPRQGSHKRRIEGWSLPKEGGGLMLEKGHELPLQDRRGNESCFYRARTVGDG